MEDIEKTDLYNAQQVPPQVSSFLRSYLSNKFPGNWQQVGDMLGCANCELTIGNKNACRECIEINRTALHDVLRQTN